MTTDAIAREYASFAEVQAAPVSPRYADLTRAIARDADVLAFLAELPAPKRQPNLLLGALRYLHGVAADPAELHAWVTGDRERLRATMLARSTQTNEAARCAAFLPLLPDGPLTLVEVGSSAGLCLYPDRYAYDYDGRRVGGPSTVELRCTTTGPVPGDLPTVVARIGIDLNPLDPADADDRAWLRALVWPGPQSEERLRRLDAACEIAARERATMLRGDLLDLLPGAVASAPGGSTVVVLHTAVLMYLDARAREAFVELVGSLPVRWIAQESRGVVPGQRVVPGTDGRFVLALDGRPVALTAPHGGRVDWLDT
jgi:hypothetical protein